MVQPVLFANLFERERSLDDLIEESKADADFHLYLSISAIITTFGLLADNGVVVIGGMLVAPILYPLLAFSMAIATSSRQAIRRAIRVLGRSIAIAVVISFVTAFLFHDGEITAEVLMRTEPDLISFLIAFFAGIAAAFGWVKRRSVSSTLAGIAVSVSLIPPLATFGIGLAAWSKDIISGSITLFFINLLGIVLAGIIIFALFGFSNLQQEEEKKIEDEELEAKIQSEALESESHQEETEESTPSESQPDDGPEGDMRHG